MLPGDASVVTSIPRASDLQSAKNGRAISSACDSPCPAMRTTRVITRLAPARPRQPLADEDFHHRLQLTWRTRQQHDHALVVFQPQAWRRAVGVRQITAPSGTMPAAG